MLIKNVFTHSVSKASAIRAAVKFLLAASILAGFTTACGTTYPVPTSEPIAEDAAVSASDVLPLQEPAAISPQTHLPGHDFGAINSNFDPTANQRADPPAFFYWSNGQMVVRRSELGPLTDPISNPSANPVVDPPLVLGPGHDYGAINSTIDPGKNQCVVQPKITYTFNGIIVVRRSELGPLTETVDNCLQTVEP